MAWGGATPPRAPPPWGGGANAGFGGERGGALILGHFELFPKFRDAPTPTGGSTSRFGWEHKLDGGRRRENLVIFDL